VEVANVFALSWLEDHIEIQKQVEIGTLNVIALDKSGRKFTNCTAVHTTFDIKGEGIISAVSTPHSYSSIKHYVSSKKDLISLKQRFDENSQAIVISDLKDLNIPFSDNKLEVIMHNNFGICY
jgi:hypothetical protein